MGNKQTLHTRLIEYFISDADPNDVARKLNLEFEYVSSMFSSWRLGREQDKKDLERMRIEANKPVFSVLPSYKIFESTKPVSNFCLETDNHEVILAYNRMINPPKNGNKTKRNK